MVKRAKMNKAKPKRDAAGVIKEGNFFDTQFQDDLDPTGPLPGQDNESDIDESLIVEKDYDVDIDSDEEATPPPNLKGQDAIIGQWNTVDLDLGLDQNEDSVTALMNQLVLD
ncbi:hypothetical protein PoB_005634700 [Plakobranchus ocellatus]|uniref:Uncharacterized protein n=1 Tax=Plakobranchus ocellatus TaxID=259542 RepID=A0AAV4CES1_9GAST|nr:hypothetical protein PoB_005634700 [Plakobranchus ocellatus]